jgi:hypothetical protein
MKAFNKKKKPKHFTKTKIVCLYEDSEYIPTWLVSRRVSWTENGMTSTIKYHSERLD